MSYKLKSVVVFFKVLTCLLELIKKIYDNKLCCPTSGLSEIIYRAGSTILEYVKIFFCYFFCFIFSSFIIFPFHLAFSEICSFQLRTELQRTFGIMLWWFLRHHPRKCLLSMHRTHLISVTNSMPKTYVELSSS